MRNNMERRKMKQTRTILKNLVEKLKEKAFNEGFKQGFIAGMNRKQWDMDIEKGIQKEIPLLETIRHRTVSELFLEKEK